MKRKEACRIGLSPAPAEKRTPCNAEFSSDSNILSTENQVLSDASEEISEATSSEENDCNTIKSQSLKSILEAATEKKEQRPSLPALPEDTELSIAKYLIEKSRELLTYCPENNEWMIFKNGKWKKAYKADVHHEIDKLYALLAEYSKLDKEIPENIQQRIFSLKKKISGFKGRDNIVKIMQNSYDCITPTDLFDVNLNLLNFENVTMELDTFTVREHRAEDRLTQAVNTIYDPKAKCPRFLKFMNGIFPGDEALIQFVIIFFGVILDPRLTLHFLLFFIGTGSNGKSILLKVIETVLADYSLRIPAEALMKNKYGADRSQNEIARIIGKRLVITTETEKGQRLNEACIKDLVGGDRLTGRRLYCETREFEPQHKVIMYGNYLPRILSTDNGIWRRIHVIPFNVTFSGKTKRKPDKLLQELLEEKAGIMNLLIEGLKNARKGAMENVPKSILDETEEYRCTSDPIRQFMTECTQAVKNFKGTSSRDLFKSFQEWKIEANMQDFSSQIAFTKHLKTLGYEDKVDRTKKTIFVGIKLT